MIFCHNKMLHSKMSHVKILLTEGEIHVFDRKCDMPLTPSYFCIIGINTSHYFINHLQKNLSTTSFYIFLNDSFNSYPDF